MEFMDGQTLTRLLIWLAVLAWAVVMAGWLSERRLPGRRWIWTAGWLAYVGHAVAAFHFFYGWSHETGLEETARQTEEMTGWRSGIGLWLNYLVLVWWGLDVGRWWRTGMGWIEGKGHWRTLAFQTFLAFMIFNGTVVFGSGPVRWFGVFLFAFLATLYLRAKLRAKTSES